jgi:hypothetical protein
MGKRDNRFLMVLDIDKLFSADERAIVENTGAVSRLNRFGA